MTVELFECNCCSEGISLERVDHEVFLCIWERGYRPEGLAKRTFWERVKTAWKILTKGHLYNDQICLNPSEAKSLATTLMKLSQEAKEDLDNAIRSNRNTRLKDLIEEING